MGRVYTLGLAALAVGLGAGLSGCGTPAAPQPPSLKLPDPVADLVATRAGSQVSLAWTMPKKNTDKLLLKEKVEVRVCRQLVAGGCEQAGDLYLAPGAAGSFTEALPPPLTSGPPRPLSYFVELKNRHGRSAGLSNVAVVLAGKAPAAVAGFWAEVRKSGVVLHWTADSEEADIRLARKLLTPAPKPPPGLLAPPPEPVEQSLLVEDGARLGRALDNQIRFGQTYEYRAQRVIHVTVEGKTLELAGAQSDAVRTEALDTFPPTVPTGLAAVATAPGNSAIGAETAIDLSWQPGVDADLAGYAVYRREGSAPWQRISPSQPLAGPAFHDAQVLPGHTYSYAVSAIDQGGHESAHSAEAQETIPTP